MKKFALLSGAILGFLGVAFGAFGAHALKPTLEASGRLDTFELAVRYQFYHVFALLLAGMMLQHFQNSLLRYAVPFFFLGILFFCGSLYILSLTGTVAAAFVTPIGGVLLLLGWTFMAAGVVKNKAS
jgi:uncharacterized membrane protein YgdD (TMEM256/DUF423 family)